MRISPRTVAAATPASSAATGADRHRAASAGGVKLLFRPRDRAVSVNPWERKMLWRLQGPADVREQFHVATHHCRATGTTQDDLGQHEVITRVRHRRRYRRAKARGHAVTATGEEGVLHLGESLEEVRLDRPNPSLACSASQQSQHAPTGPRPDPQRRVRVRAASMPRGRHAGRGQGHHPQRHHAARSRGAARMRYGRLRRGHDLGRWGLQQGPVPAGTGSAGGRREWNDTMAGSSSPSER